MSDINNNTFIKTAMENRIAKRKDLAGVTVRTSGETGITFEFPIHGGGVMVSHWNEADFFICERMLQVFAAGVERGKYLQLKQESDDRDSYDKMVCELRGGKNC